MMGTAEIRVGVRTYREKLLLQISFWISAAAVGIAAVYFSRLITMAQVRYASFFVPHPYIMSLITPLAFIAAAGVCRWAPHAGGSGVPQVLHAIQVSNESSRSPVQMGLVSPKTALVKVLSSTIGFLGGASIGGEGPTVQISAVIFGTLGERIRKYFPKLNLQSYLVAAAGAGIAAAFNTPLGGIAFALEEAAIGDFGPLRHLVILAVIVAGLVAEALAGSDLYLGNPGILGASPVILSWLPTAISIGIAGGVLGGLFCRLAASTFFSRTPLKWWGKAALCGLVVAALNFFYHGATGGSGYSVTRELMEHGASALPLSFPVAKLLATALSTLSGLGGGILAPSLSIGAWVGVSIGKLAAFADLKSCALIGMVAYFTGAFRIPLTALIIVTEMTNEHSIIFPMMAAALVADLVARFIMPVPLYHIMVERIAGNDPDQ